jgi:gliding motility-associated-like protein
MKKLLTTLLFLIASYYAMAAHTKGGWMYYSYLGPGSSPNTARYKITLKIYTKCILDNPAQFCPTVIISIFNGANNFLLEKVPVVYSNAVDISNCASPECHPCISLIPNICVKITTYEFIKELPITQQGYTIAYQRCCRISGIINLKPPTDFLGDTWTVKIPGTAISPDAPFNSSAIFPQNDTAIICRENYFTYNFGASDPNNDSLSYAFSDAFAGTPDGTTSGSCINDYAQAPPYSSVNYQEPYSGSLPLGISVTIDPRTGLVSGVAPSSSGVYVLTVTVSEYIRGTNIKKGEVRKSLHVEVTDCITTKALLDPEYYSCDDLTASFENKTSGYTILRYDWEFGDPASGANNFSNAQFPTHVYSAPGEYVLKLVVNRGDFCSDSTTAIVKVYPVFNPGFTVQGQCSGSPIQFTDISTSTSGVVNYWSWNFGDLNASAQDNVSSLQNPSHTYTRAANYDVMLIVATDKGCRDTLFKTIPVTKSPELDLSNDTLICYIDTVQLKAHGSGNFAWTPNYMISNTAVANPLVSPDVPTTYRVSLTDAVGCVTTDSVKVDVRLFVTLTAANDSTICQGDPTPLKISSDALKYLWSPATSLNDPTLKNPVATPQSTTTYHVIASIGKCTAEENITLIAVPYPAANAGADQLICLGRSTQLQASGGTFYSWSPTAFLNAANISNPVVGDPTGNVRYVVTVRDIQGCPKPVRDTMILTVAQIKADAGPRDTSVVIDQPLQLNAAGSTNYLWTPSTWLSNVSINNPVALPQNNIEYVVRVSNAAGCFDTDSILVKVFKVKPGFYVPTAFSPNGDGLNDIFRPVAIGMKSVGIFRVYNRWGQLLYSASGTNIGWDGTLAGKAQEAASYVWQAEGVDYLNNKVSIKGYVVLIR